MAESERSDAEEPRDSGIFGNLPRSRPGIRSPRRDARRPRRDEPASEPARPKAPAARTRPAAPPPPPPPPRRPEPVAEDEEGGGLDDLAWAGLTVAAEAATAGVRLLNRALEAAREAVERR
jgi:hypothetical protein